MSCNETKFVIRGFFVQKKYKYSDFLVAMYKKYKKFLVKPTEIERKDGKITHIHWDEDKVVSLRKRIEAAIKYEQATGKVGDIEIPYILNYDYDTKVCTVDCLLDYEYGAVRLYGSVVNAKFINKVVEDMKDKFDIPIEQICVGVDTYYNGVDELVSTADDKAILGGIKVENK